MPFRQRELEAAKGWGLTPWQFDAKHQDEKAEMVASHWVTQIVESYYNDEAAKRMEKK